MAEPTTLSDWQLSMYLGELALQCEFAVFQAQLVDDDVRAHNPPQAVHMRLFALMAHAANVSKLLWPDLKRADHPKVAEARGKALRRRLGFPKSFKEHPLGQRGVRNALEHFDERLDDWVAAHADGGGVYIDLNMGPLSAFGVKSEADVMRNYDPRAARLVVYGDGLNLRELVPVLRALGQRARSEELRLRGPPVAPWRGPVIPGK